MAQMGFFDVDNRYAALDAKNDPLAKINAAVPWEAFRSRLESVWRKPADQRKSNAGCKPWDAIIMFKAIILYALYNLSDDQVEYQMRDRLSFVRFLGLTLQDKVPDAKTVWLYRERLSRAGLIDALFEDFDGYLKSQGYRAMGGQMIDASIVAVPIQRNSRDENEQIILRLRSGVVSHPTLGRMSRPSVGKRACPRLDRGTRMHAGRRSMARATMATRTTWALTVGTS